MFAILASFSLQQDYFNFLPGGDEEHFQWQWVKWEADNNQGYDGDFNIVYNWFTTTYRFSGWRPILKVDNFPEVKILGINDGVAKDHDITVTTNFTLLGKNYLLIKFIATNTGEDPHKISIASFTDVKINSNDRAECGWYDGNRGLSMYDDQTNTNLTLVVRDGYEVTNVDTFWFGEFNGLDKHYFENAAPNTHLKDIDSTFSLGWQNRVIYPGQTIPFGVLLGIGQGLKNPPTLTVDETKFNQNYGPGERPRFYVTIKEKDFDKNVMLYWNVTTNGITQAFKAIKPYTKNNFSNGIKKDEFNVILPNNVSSTEVKVWAQKEYDGYNLSSNVYTRNFLVNQAPRLHINKNQLQSRYLKGSHIEIQGTLWDDTFANISYQFDDDYEFTIKDKIECYGQEKTILKSYSIREKGLNYGPHTLRIWATDEFGVQSERIVHQFEYVNYQAPEIRINHSHVMPVYEYNQIVAIDFQVQDTDYGDSLKVWYAGPPSSQEFSQTNQDPIQTNGNWQDQTFLYQIPLLEEKNYSIILKVVDSYGASSNFAYYNFTWKKTPPRTPLPTPSPFPTPPTIPPPPPTNRPDNTADSSSSSSSSTQEKPINYTSYTCVTTIDPANGNITCSYSTTIKVITKDGNTYVDILPTPTAEPNDDFIVITGAQKEKSGSDSKKTTPIFIGAGIAVAVAAAIAAAIIIREASKKAAEFNPEEVGQMEGVDDAAFENDNPIFNEHAVEDPFANDFDVPVEPV